MGSLFDCLPGERMPVNQVTRAVERMWDDLAAEGRREARASQLNLILHFGSKTPEDEALVKFHQAIEFAQRYPCRIVVLCPEHGRRCDEVLEGKLFSLCYLGPNLREVCCCEALILGYPVGDAEYLENQVSLWLESDLPIYHWYHRVAATRVGLEYQPFLKRCRRVLFDGDADAHRYAEISWPHPERVRDLAYARSLPLRQGIGQFLSGFTPRELIRDLAQVHIAHASSCPGLAHGLGDWAAEALKECRVRSAQTGIVEFRQTCQTEPQAESLVMQWQRSDGSVIFRWAYTPAQRTARFTGDFGRGRFEQSVHVEPLSGPAALAEALFFA